MHAVVDRETLVETQPKRRWRRLALMAALPVVLIMVALYVWLTGGQSVSTDNAYVQQDKVSISSDVSGRVVDVLPRESQAVKRGDVLIRLDPQPFQITLAQANATLASARLQVSQLQSGTTGKNADVAGKRDAVAYARINLERQEKLMKDGFTTRASLQTAQLAVQTADSDLDSAIADASMARAAANEAGRGTHPLILAAMAARDKAALDLARSIVHAPADGVVSQTNKLQPGQMMIMGVPTLSLVVSNHRWIEANFKETDLEHMRVGQKAIVKLDAFPGTPIEGKVESIGAGTGSEFSVLPAQNATGNWVKVVQRVPVRIALPAQASVPLIAGLSATVTVKTPR